jgi:putative tryptophan/tyrosine transport system substrate-binding protein
MTLGRRHFLASLFATVPVSVVLAQEKARMPRIGILDWMPSATAPARLAPLRQSLRAFGLIEGQNIAVDYRSAEENTERAEALARELARENVDIIIAIATPATHAAAQATTSIPIVISAADPLGTGLVTSLARPGGNITGVSTMLPDLASKRLELLREIIPGLHRVGFVGSTRDPATALFIRETRQAVQGSGINVVELMITDATELDGAMATLARQGCQAIIMQPLFLGHRQRIAELQIEHRVPVISDPPIFARAGTLLSYGLDTQEMNGRMARYVDQLLKGAKAGDLPIEQPSTFRLAINLKTAQALGITIPPTIIARADEVIE